MPIYYMKGFFIVIMILTNIEIIVYNILLFLIKLKRKLN